MVDPADARQGRGSPCDLIDESTQLTVLPAAVPELLAALSDEELTFQRLAAILADFPSIAARLIFLANSAWAAPVEEISSLEKACVKLGLSLVKSVSISIAIAAPFDPAKCLAFQSERFWSTAVLVADAALWLAAHSPHFADDDLGAVHTAALLHNLGLLWMADNLPERTNRAFEIVAADPSLSVPEVLREKCGADHAQIGGCLASAWNFPAMIRAAMQHHLDFSYDGENWPVAQLTGYAASMVHHLDHEIEVLPEDLRLERLGISSASRDAVFERLQQRHEQVHEMVKVLFC